MRIIKDNEPVTKNIQSLCIGDFFELYEELCLVTHKHGSGVNYRRLEKGGGGDAPFDTKVREVEIISINYRTI